MPSCVKWEEQKPRISINKKTSKRDSEMFVARGNVFHTWFWLQVALKSSQFYAFFICQKLLFFTFKQHLNTDLYFSTYARYSITNSSNTQHLGSGGTIKPTPADRLHGTAIPHSDMANGKIYIWITIYLLTAGMSNLLTPSLARSLPHWLTRSVTIALAGQAALFAYVHELKRDVVTSCNATHRHHMSSIQFIPTHSPRLYISVYVRAIYTYICTLKHYFTDD